ncbi:MAG TPA: hydroxymethylglutaryl-CoA lyase [Planctomycetota bacterium]|nr:hydroxymethylglutaryl-CoA lyase [Planctomycetota bacterium]
MNPIRIVEVGPRDGLQNEQEIVPTDVKIAFIEALSQTGLREIEAGAFVSPKWIPQLADSDEVFAKIRRVPGVVYSALVPNEQGFDRARGAGAEKIAVFTAASETFNKKNINATIEESIQRFEPVLIRAVEAKLAVRGYVSTAFWCPYEGKIAPGPVVEVAKRLLDLGVHELSIGDTIGKASPDEVKALLDVLLPVAGAGRVAMHFHDTYGRAIENCRASYALGIRTFDSSAGGIGGCPYAPGASGNVSTQALVDAFPDSGLNREALDTASNLLRSRLPLRRPAR